ncbi:monooxygenase [Acinetobacter silvestris]|uniref:Monooxygenase n=1 Tax=Acinetobacter silvestris TaxID=1977882 RepID=A0A1Y3CH09_9GAMM|nr:monooxygenase [Acinetobacter silvestris]OTG66395.1 monooxygenase [Acinetobacter silvestris]
MAVILQVDFPSQGPFQDEMTLAFKTLAESINQETGMLWKIWTENSETKEVGGIYLFDTQENAQKYLNMHTARLEGFGLSSIRSKIFDINNPLSILNHAIFLPE